VASPALTVKKPTEGFFQVPSSFAENQAAMIPAERALAIILFRRATDSRGITNFAGTATISDRTWEAWTGMKPRMKELATRGLKDRFGLAVDGRGDTAKFRFDLPVFNSALQCRERSNYDPKRKERDARAVTAKAGAKVHADCHENGCSMLRDGGCNTPPKQSSPLLVMPNAQPVAQIASESPSQPSLKNDSKQKSPSVSAPVAQPVAQTPKEDPETKWVKTLAAMRSQFASAGVALLMKLLALLMSFADLRNVSDYVLAEAVAQSYADSRGRWNSPILLIKTVPDVLRGWKAKGQPLDDTGEDDFESWLSRRTKDDPPEPPRPKKKRAVDYL